MRILVAVIAILSLVACTNVKAHDAWVDGQPIPAWVKKSCCGPDDAHMLVDGAVTTGPDGYRIAGYPDPIPYGSPYVFPSLDGKFWAFFDASGGKFSRIYCFFVPGAGS